MKTWSSLRYTNVVLIVALVFNIEECFQISSNVVAGQLSSAGLNTDAINRHLLRLQQSLRLIRSPKPKARFRPWGGKRGYKPFHDSPDYYYSTLCSVPNNPLEMSFSSKCSDILSKRDKFRPWGGKRDDKNWGDNQNQGEPSSLEDYEVNELQRPFYPPLSKFERGMPESVSFGRTDEPNVDDPFIPSYFDLVAPIDIGKMTAAMAQKASNNIQTIKRQRFNPWGGKRTQRFNPWAGKRSELHPFTDGNVHTINEKNDAEIQKEDQLRNAQPRNLIYDQDSKSARKKRETASDNHEKPRETNNPQVPDNCAGEEVDGKRCQRPVKRSLKSLGVESIKRIGTLSDILKEYESLVGGTTQRSFHPWAGKRSHREEEDELQSKNSHSQAPAMGDVLPTNEERDTEAKPLRIVKRNSNLVFDMPAGKRQSFHPWAGKRNNAQSRENGFGWLDYPDFFGQFRTGSKKAFNPWAGK